MDAPQGTGAGEGAGERSAREPPSELALLGQPIDWEAQRRRAGSMPGNGLNLAWQALERHARDDRAHLEALRFLGDDGTRSLTFAELAREARRCAQALRGLGVRRGDRVFLLLERSPELFAGFFGALECGAVAAPLHAGLGPEPIRSRLELGKARVLLTSAALHERCLGSLAPALARIAYVVAVEQGQEKPPSGTIGYHQLLAKSSPEFAIERMEPRDPALLHFTSGTTGSPKGVLHAHGAGVMIEPSARLALDLRAEDVYLCTADPGWLPWTVYGMLAPLSLGATSVVPAHAPEGESLLSLLAREGVSVCYTTSLALRSLRRTDAEDLRHHDLSRLRVVASVGEPLGVETVAWTREGLGLPVHDTWMQTETGAILIANPPAFGQASGAMGRPLPGVEAFLVRRDEDGGVTLVEEPEGQGELALRTGWPSMFHAYLGGEKRNGGSFAGDLYLTGDLVRRDVDGNLWFVARTDDLIRCAGQRIGPAEVEGVLAQHEAVAEAAAIGAPDPLAGECVKAFVALKGERKPSEELRAELLAFARVRLGPVLAPVALEFRPVLPRTRGGALMRRLLREQERAERTRPADRRGR